METKPTEQMALSSFSSAEIPTERYIINDNLSKAFRLCDFPNEILSEIMDADRPTAALLALTCPQMYAVYKRLCPGPINLYPLMEQVSPSGRKFRYETDGRPPTFAPFDKWYPIEEYRYISHSDFNVNPKDTTQYGRFLRRSVYYHATDLIYRQHRYQIVKEWNTHLRQICGTSIPSPFNTGLDYTWEAEFGVTLDGIALAMEDPHTLLKTIQDLYWNNHSRLNDVYFFFSRRLQQAIMNKPLVPYGEWRDMIGF